MPAGRPPKYDPDSMPVQAKKLCTLGATDNEIADFFEVTPRTINRWKLDHPEFCHSLKVGKKVADERVKRALYQSAVGYDFKEEQAFKVKVGTLSEEVEVVEVTRHMPADKVAAIFWLKNRDPENWAEKQKIEHSGVEVVIRDFTGDLQEDG